MYSGCDLHFKSIWGWLHHLLDGTAHMSITYNITENNRLIWSQIARDITYLEQGLEINRHETFDHSSSSNGSQGCDRVRDVEFGVWLSKI